MTPHAASTGRHTLPLILVARLASQVGTSLHFVAQGWFIYRLTGDGRLLGVATIVPLLGPLVLGGVSGRPSDCYPARSVLAVTQTLLAATTAALGLLAYTARMEVWTLLAGTALMSVIATFAAPAWQLLTAELAGDGNVRRTTALSTSALDLGTVVGSASAAAVIAVTGLGGAFVLNGLSYAVVAAVMLTVRGGNDRVRRETPAPGDTVRAFLTRPDLLPVVVIAVVASAAGAGLQPLLLMLAEQESPVAYGWFLAALALGSIAATALTWRARATASTIGGGAVAMGVLVAALGPAGGAWTVAALLLPIGVLLLSLRAGIVAYIQMRAPGGAGGRVISSILAILAGAQIGGTLGLSSLAEATSAGTAMITAGVSQTVIVAALAGTWLRRGARRPIGPVLPDARPSGVARAERA
ncbi:MFS transporter [Krasilnikovia sp. MM14-A1004]|uniref:MFS transporter n=1 Tax=Krasilnikovia sp. MM14-A1004 TaxID=3373541 RepID=UPI00399C886C